MRQKKFSTTCTIFVYLHNTDKPESAHKDACKFNYKIHVPVKMRRKGGKMNFMRRRSEKMNYIWI